MIKSVIKFANDMVVVFDKDGEQIFEYQGRYEAVKDSIRQDAPSDAVFAHGFTEAAELRRIPREDW